jgi:hypothetical protein
MAEELVPTTRGVVAAHELMWGMSIGELLTKIEQTPALQPLVERIRETLGQLGAMEQLPLGWLVREIPRIFEERQRGELTPAELIKELERRQGNTTKEV